MKINVIACGKLGLGKIGSGNLDSSFQTILKDYQKRLKWKLEIIEINLKSSTKNFNNNEIEQYKKAEAILIIKAYKSNSKFSNNSKLIALDENGKQFSSFNFSKIIADYQLNGCSELNFVIGGAFGLAKEVLELANLQLSLGAMTMPHMIARIILIEQIYRAQTIIAGHPYHKE